MHVEFVPSVPDAQPVETYLAVFESGAGVLTADTLPEEKAKELAAVEVAID